jgi:hypothetical protein
VENERRKRRQIKGFLCFEGIFIKLQPNIPRVRMGADTNIVLTKSLGITDQGGMAEVRRT